MAVLGVACTFFHREAGALLRRPYILTSLQIRNKSYDRNSEEVKGYVDFRKELGKARKKFQAEIKSQQQMKMEGFNTQAAEEKRLEREREERALEENKKELERMQTEREKKNVILEQKKEERRQRGEHVRQQMEEKKTAERTTVVHNLEEQSYGFITMENLNEKIQEALDYEVDYNFALSSEGKKITS